MTRRNSKPVAGRLVPSPRLTLHGAVMIALFGGLPIVTLGLLLDLLLWLLA